MSNEPLPLNTARQLGYLGLLPFFAGAVGPWVFPAAEAWLTQAMIVYSLAILSFLCGSWWGLVINTAVSGRDTHLVASNLFLLAGWGSLLLPTPWCLGTLIVCHLGVYWWERHTHLKYAVGGAEYLQLRNRLAWPAVACHMLAIFNVIRDVPAAA